MGTPRMHRQPRTRRRLRACAAGSIAAATALAVSSFPALAGDHRADPGTFRAGNLPLEVVRPAPRAGTYHQVGPGEHLSSIAARYGLAGPGGWRRLYDANPNVSHPDRLEPGQRVRIPADSEQLEPRDLPTRAPASVARGSSRGSRAPGGSVWDRLARCESGGDWHVDTGNGYYGGLQFSLRSWQAVGGTGYPHEHSRQTQIAMAERLLARQGWGAWPSCSRRLGLR